MPIIIFTTILTISTLYAPQPLLPVLAREFGVSRDLAATLTTVVFIPLSLAPLLYGYLLETLSLRRLLRGGVLLLAVFQLLCFLAPSFRLLFLLRLGLGLLVPALLTALMTYVAATAPKSQLSRAMAIYIASTILGGFLGRACSGALATWFGWRYSFLALALSLLLAWLVLGRLAPAPGQRLARPRADLLPTVLANRQLLRIYLAIACLFFVFAAVMNYLPFRLTDLSSKASELRIGLMYSGYLMGIATSLGAVRAARLLGGQLPVMAAGFAVFCLALLGLASGRVTVLFVVMFLFCGAMFLVHATATGYVNGLSSEHRPMVNGLYVGFYYGGGALGSWLPGLVYRDWGWGAFLALLGLVAGFGLLTILAAGRASSSNY
jgi:MFS transporter, YNFM family, putative membrane transport protein